ncbi:hypothetical protein COCC4DRAFT_42218 [Bipolaris maydis ATCC 48331]|uniref:Uncharacterized protein n=2 Tax=Cochliobolus heterostrophus TaxID=5016 RepID=M2UFM2_COCH5|nr:uncharacterized protein COCC4DRAFT_42218 [Bipolaris maydis ATCC 48331]EMD86788.1 hypothetical protein COCHEDRAFT_1034552 [Bipolaris maydis C5]ENI03181.1 hypothetical protein COCC4DRAFT_42218 [Bipolaris maydis ATCC 48331]KAJ6267305.1 hypothetical protein PSV08DRAFT_354895 [Bipolaris maydis]
MKNKIHTSVTELLRRGDRSTRPDDWPAPVHRESGHEEMDVTSFLVRPKNAYKLHDSNLRDLLVLSRSSGYQENSDGTWTVKHGSEEDKNVTIRYITTPRSKDAWRRSVTVYDGVKVVLG